VVQVLEKWTPVKSPTKATASPVPTSLLTSSGNAAGADETLNEDAAPSTSTDFNPFASRVPKSKKKFVSSEVGRPSILDEFDQYLAFDHEVSINEIAKSKQDMSAFTIASTWWFKIGRITYPRLYRV
jgi:hypothetical protein